MADEQQFQVGNVLQTTGTFTNAKDNNAPIDPNTVHLSLKKPSGSVTTYNFGDPDATIVKESVGVYSANFDLDEAGRWRVRWWSTGTGQASLEICLRALPKET